MDVLSNIWNLLTTENEMLTKIVTAPTVVIENLIAFKLIISLLHFQYTSRQRLIYIVFLSASSLITEFFISSPFNILINYLILFIFIKLLFKQSIIKTIIATFLPTIAFALIGILILKPILIIFNISVNQAQYTPIYKIIYLFLLYIFVLIITKLLSNKDIKLILNGSLNKKDKLIILSNFTFGFFTLCIQLAITAFYTDILPFTITLLSSISLLAYFFINIYSLTKICKLQVTTQNLENAENYNKALSTLYDNVKAFKHDFDNMVFTIGGFINTSDLDGLKKYYTSLEKDCQKVNTIALFNPRLINNPGIYNLLITKYKKAENQNIDIQLEFFFDLNKLNMPIYDFSRMLGIFLDNAIEAASLSKEKIIKISFRDYQKSRCQIIQIENSYNNKNINTQKIFEKSITEKENHLGMGLWEVKQILKRNNNINLITKNGNLYFNQCLEIYY